MSSARKGQRKAKRAARGPTGASEGRQQYALTLLKQIEKRLLDTDGDQVLADSIDHLKLIVDKVTHSDTATGRETYDLDTESTYPTEGEFTSPQTDSHHRQIIFRTPKPLELHTVKGPGRASVHRRRDRYFPPVPPVNEEEQRERSIRSNQANFRKARLKARDIATQEDCGLWVGLTVDDIHVGRLSPGYVSKFLNKVALKHKRNTGQHLRYVAVIGMHGRGPHVHALFSRNLDPELLRENWELGAVDEITEIPESMIERKVNYMADNIADIRMSRNRFFRSRGTKIDKTVTEVADIEDARNTLADQIYPQRPRLIYAEPFGDNPRVRFRFDPIRE